MWMKIRNTFAIFLVSGFWHGANWTFIVWGGLNAIYFLPLLLTKTNRQNLEVIAQDKFLPSLKELFQVIVTFAITCFAWIFFRADSVSDALMYIKTIGTGKWELSNLFPSKVFALIGIMLLIEWINRSRFHGFEIKRYNPWLRRALYVAFLYIIIRYANFGNNEFIYFQF